MCVTSIENWRTAVENALQLDPTDSCAYACLVNLRACLGDLEGAERAHRRAFEYGSHHAGILPLLAGSRALVVGDPAEAIPLIERAMRLNPLAPPWYFGMQGRVLFAAGRHREAIAALRRSAPESPDVLMFLALAHAAMGETGEAARIAARLKAEFPELFGRTLHRRLSRDEPGRVACHPPRRRTGKTSLRFAQFRKPETMPLTLAIHVHRRDA